MSSATTSGGWAAASPYIGQSAQAQPSAMTLGADGNASAPQSSDVGAQLGYALSAYHTHQTANAPSVVNSQNYGGAAATQNSQDLGAALQASTPNTTTSYAAPAGMNRLGIAIQPTATAAPSAANGGVMTGTTNTADVPTTTAAAQSPYISFMNSAGTTSWAKYDAATGQYVPFDTAGIDYDRTYSTNNESGAVVNGKQTINASPNQIYLTGGGTSAYTDDTGQGKAFSLTNLNATLAQATAANQAKLSGLAGASNAATTAAQATTTDPVATVNNNQDFINSLGAQLTDINSAPGVVAADQTSANTQAALSSQLSTSGYQSGDLGASARYGAGAAVGAEGAGALSHEQAAANAYDATFAQIGQAASQQLSLADSETQQQASQDVQSIADEVSSLQSQLGQLDTTTANQVAQHLATLQDQISAYQNGVASYTGTAQASAADFKAILSAAAQVGTIMAAA